MRMKPTVAKLSFLLAVLAASTPLYAEEALPRPVLRHPVEEVSIPDFLPAEAREQPHILFVNVGEALDSKACADAAAYIRSRWMIATWTNSVESVNISELMTTETHSRETHPKNAVLVVYVVNDEHAANFLTQPGSWALINVRGLDKDAPEPLLLTKRTRQMFLKGLCFAAGVGVNADVFCVMYAGGFTREGMDAVSATLSPFAYAPLMETLRRMVGSAVFVSF